MNFMPFYHCTFTHADIDECLAAALEGMDVCESDKNSQCLNTEGSFDCVCVPGYVVTNGSCQRKLEECFLHVSVG